MFCNICGKEIPKGVVFCPKCGNKVHTGEVNKENEEPKAEIKGNRQKIVVLLFAVVIVALLLLGIMAVIFVPKARLKAKLSLGEKYLSELEYDNAIIAYEAAISIDPKSEAAYEGLAQAYSGKGEYTRAAKVIELGLSRAGYLDALLKLQSEITQSISAEQKSKDVEEESKEKAFEPEEIIADIATEADIEETEEEVDDSWIDAYTSYLSSLDTFEYPEGRIFYLGDDPVPEILLEGNGHYLGSIALTIGKDNTVSEHRFGNNYVYYMPGNDIIYDCNSGAGDVHDDIICIEDGQWKNIFYGWYSNDNIDPHTGEFIDGDFEIHKKGYYEEGAGLSVSEEEYYNTMNAVFTERGYKESNAKMIDDEQAYSISELIEELDHMRSTYN